MLLPPLVAWVTLEDLAPSAARLWGQFSWLPLDSQIAPCPVTEDTGLEISVPQRPVTIGLSRQGTCSPPDPGGGILSLTPASWACPRLQLRASHSLSCPHPTGSQ